MPTSLSDPYFNIFRAGIDGIAIPDHFNLMIEKPHPLCLMAAHQLQDYLIEQNDWVHNFGLDADSAGTIIGKMFGVLVVQNRDGALGFLSAFSGKLAGSNQHAHFVPPVFDLLTENSFLNVGMEALTQMNEEIKRLEVSEDTTKVHQLKKTRKAHSVALQSKIFQHYYFLNQAGEEKNLIEIFQNLGYKNPPAGAGECAAPKLLQYAFQHQMKPIALAEFWWGQSPKSAFWKHGLFYPCCKEKCEPIFMHMLAGIA